MSADRWLVKSVPSERDWEVHRLVTVERLSTRQTAKMLEISQTRVVQIVKRVHEALCEFSPTEKDPARRHQQLYVAEAIGVERLGRLYRRALDCFELSREENNAKRTSHGDVRYLNVALRIAVQLAKIPVNDLLLHAQVAADEYEESRRQETIPSKEACSPASREQPVNAPVDHVELAATGLLDDDYDADIDDEELAKLLGAETVQLLADGLSDNEEAEAIAQVASPPPRRLGRKERRARQRRLEKSRR